MSNLNQTAKTISEKYIGNVNQCDKSKIIIPTRSAQAEINRIEAVISSLSNGNISDSEVVRLESVCLKLLGRIRSLSINMI